MTPPVALRRSPICVVASAVLAGVLLFLGAREASRRARVEAFVARSAMAVHRPLEAASIALEPDADLAATAAVSVALHVPEGVGSADSSARQLAAEALASRPGWPLHAELLAESAYRESRRAGGAVTASGWMTAWRAATKAAPGVRLFRLRFGEACLAAWSSLSGDLRTQALEAIRVAMVDPEFVAAHIAEAADAVGVERAITLLPARADALRAAAAVLAGRSLEQAKALLDRADSAREGERSTALRRLEAVAKGTKPRERAEACRAFAEEYPAERLPDRPRADQAARLLALWPAEPGDWETDARAPLVRALLETGGAAEMRSAPDARRAVEALVGAPAPVVASVLDAAGDRAAAEKMRNSIAPAAAFDWVAYDARSARRALSRGDVRDARRDLERIPAARRGECEALLVQRDLAARTGDSAAATDALGRLATLDSERAKTWRDTGRRRMCIGAATPDRALSLTVDAAAPAIVAFGWDGSQAGSRLVSGSSRWEVPVPEGGGDRELWVTTLAGGPAVPLEAGRH